MHESSFKRGVKHVRQVETPRFDVVGVTDVLSLVVEDGLCVSQPHGASGQVVRLAATPVVFR